MPVGGTGTFSTGPSEKQIEEGARAVFNALTTVDDPDWEHVSFAQKAFWREASFRCLKAAYAVPLTEGLEG